MVRCFRALAVIVLVLLGSGCACRASSRGDFQWLRKSDRENLAKWLDQHDFAWSESGGSTIQAMSPKRPSPRSGWVLLQDSLKIRFDEDGLVKSVAHEEFLTGP